VRVLGFWVGCAASLIVGRVLGSGSPVVGVALGLVAMGLGLVAVARASSARRHGWSMLAVFVLLAARGVVASGQEATPWLGPRGPARGVRTLVVERASHPGTRCRVRVRSAGARLWLALPASACPLAAGERVRVPADQLGRAVHPEWPGGPSPAALARSRGAEATAAVERVWPAGGEPSRYWAWVADQRERAWELGRRDPARGFVVAAGMGVRDALAPADRSALRRAGLGHLVAVSGLHVGLAAWALVALAMRVGARVGASAAWGVALSWGPLWGYVLLTGASPPAVRAAAMAVGVGLAGALGRPHHGPVLLAAAAVAMLVVWPAWAFDPGFQLSVTAMATLVRAPTDEGMVRQTWRVTWAVLPVSLWHFGQAGAWGLVANLVAVPVFTLWVLPLGMLGWLVVPWLGELALAPAAWGAQPILGLARVLAGWPSPSAAAIGVAAALALGLGLGVGRRDAAGRLRAGWHWLPPFPVAALALAAVLVPRGSPGPAGRWWALGHPRAPAVVTLDRSGGSTVACIHATAGSPSRWVSVLEAMGVDAAGWAHSGVEAPHERELRVHLEVRGRWVERPDACPEPPPLEQASGVLEHCRRHAGTRHAMVVVDDDGARCFVAGQWRAIGTGALLDSSRVEEAR